MKTTYKGKDTVSTVHLGESPSVPREHIVNNLVAYRADLVKRIEAVDKRIKILKTGGSR